MPPTHQWMHNPETGGVWECPVELVGAHEARGWVQISAPAQDNSHLYDDPEDPRAFVNVSIVPDLESGYVGDGEVWMDRPDDDTPNDDSDDPSEITTTTEEQ